MGDYKEAGVKSVLILASGACRALAATDVPWPGAEEIVDIVAQALDRACARWKKGVLPAHVKSYEIVRTQRLRYSPSDHIPIQLLD